MASPAGAFGTPSAILLDAGGVLLFPEPARLLPALRAAGADPGPAALERAHYRAMADQDAEPLPPASQTWRRAYLASFAAACGLAPDQAGLVAADMTRLGWAHPGLGVKQGLRDLAALGLPMGVISNSDGSVEDDLRRTGVCHVAGGRPGNPEKGIPMGVILDSFVVGVAKPDPRIFRIALDALHMQASRAVLHVGDSLRYDIAGALAAGLRPVHMDPYGFCPQPAGHPHVASLAELAREVTG